jgi:hydrogenase maturation protein HypF
MEDKKIELPFLVKKSILALGAHTKNTICFAEGNCAFISRIHQDLDSWQDFLFFKKDLKYFFKKQPQIFACDLHPGYRSTRIANELSKGYILRRIQHHHAHIASCMVENKLKNQKVIGVAFDGTGLGEDNTLWGAEFFIANYRNFKRIAHLKYIALPGSEMAIKEPWRIALSWLYHLYRDKILDLNIDFLQKMNLKKYQVLKKMLDKKFNCPLSSSMGRLFDAVGVLVLNKFNSQYEGQLPQELERLARNFKPKEILNLKKYYFEIKKEKQNYIIDPTALFKQIIKDVKDKKDKKEIAFKFHCAVSFMVRDVCLRLRKDMRINRVVLSGGVFQNSILRKIILDLLYKDGFEVFCHREIPFSDAGISLGQVAVANFK